MQLIFKNLLDKLINSKLIMNFSSSKILINKISYFGNQMLSSFVEYYKRRIKNVIVPLNMIFKYLDRY